MPEALISKITSRGPGVGSGNSLNSSLRSPRNTTPFMISSCMTLADLATNKSPRAAPRHQTVAIGTATLAVRTVKQGNPSTHPIHGDELRALRKLQREQD